jgi:hypothetical protein
MESAREQLASGLHELMELENRLAGELADLLADVEHTETFDAEQRAEVYTILKALQADTELQRGMVNLLAHQAGEYVSDV